MLIVNADDFGLTSDINKGIIETIEKKAVNSVSLIPNGHSLDEAVNYCNNNPELKKGIHLTLIEEKPISPSKQIPSLVSKTGLMHTNYGSFMKDFFSGKINLQEIKTEFKAQIEYLISKKIILNHIDSHQHLHLLGGITDIVIELALQYKIPRIRVVNESYSLKSAARIIPLFILKRASNKIKKLTKNTIIKTVDYFFGFNDSMNVTPEIIQKAKKNSQQALVELMCHPGYNEKGSYSHWGMNWNKERETIITELGGYFNKEKN